MSKANPLITFLTDFGRLDGYVGAMYGVALQICPQATLIDISHVIPPQDIHSAAFVLYQLFDYYPSYAVHCVVVDPGVGSERKPIAIETEHGLFVGPDNGVFSLVLQASPLKQAIWLNNPTYHLSTVSHTFHGRDIFTPAAAHLANGVPLSDLGEPISHITPLNLPQITEPNSYRIIHIDHFGNLVLNLTASEVVNRDNVNLTIHNLTLTGIRNTFADTDIGEFVPYVGSTRNHVEIAMRNGNAARALEVQVGDVVYLT